MPKYLISYLTSSPILDDEGEPSSQIDVFKDSGILKKVIKDSRLKFSFRSAPATTYELRYESSEANIIHISAHGYEDDENDEAGSIGFEYHKETNIGGNDPKMGRMRKISLQEMEEITKKHKPTIVVISACHGELIAKVFVNLKVPHVITIKKEEEVDDSACVTFTECFYKGLFKGWPVKKAFNEALQEVKERHDGLNKYSPAPESKKFVLLPKAEHGDSIDLPDTGDMVDMTDPSPICSQLDQVSSGVIGRKKEMCQIYQMLHQGDASSIRFITGEARSGKSEITLEAFVYSCKRREKEQYVSVNCENETLEPLQLLKKILPRIQSGRDNARAAEEEDVENMLVLLKHILRETKDQSFALLLYKLKVGSDGISQLLLKLSKIRALQIFVTTHEIPAEVRTILNQVIFEIKYPLAPLDDSMAKSLLRKSICDQSSGGIQNASVYKAPTILYLHSEKPFTKQSLEDALPALNYSFKDRRSLGKCLVFDGNDEKLEPLPVLFLHKLYDIHGLSYNREETWEELVNLKLPDKTTTAVLLFEIEIDINLEQSQDLHSMIPALIKSQGSKIRFSATSKEKLSKKKRDSIFESYELKYLAKQVENQTPEMLAEVFRSHATSIEISTQNVDGYGGSPRLIMEAASKFMTPKKYQYCIIVSPSPTLLSPTRDAHQKSLKTHNQGHSFDKKSFTSIMKEGLKEECDKFSAVICSTPNYSLFDSSLSDSKCLVYIGTGIGMELGDLNSSSSENRNSKDLLTSSDMLPSVVILSLKYGAEMFARCLCESKFARDVRVVIWISKDPSAVVHDLPTLLASLGSCSDDVEKAFEVSKTALEYSDGDFGYIEGKAFAESTDQSLFENPLKEDKDQVVDIVPENNSPINNLFGDHPNCWTNKGTDSFNIPLAADDVGMFMKISKNVVTGSSNKYMISVCPDDLHSNRHRAVCLQVVAKYMSISANAISKNFHAIVIIESAEKLEKYNDCFINNDFSKFFGWSSDYRGLKLKNNKSKVLLWCDLDEYNSNILPILKSFSDTNRYSIMISLQKEAEHLKLENEPLIKEEKLSGVELGQCSLFSSLYDSIVLDIVKRPSDVEIDIKKLNLLSAFQEIVETLVEGIQIIGVYGETKNSLIIEVSIANVKALQHFFGLMVIDRIDEKLSKSLNEAAGVAQGYEVKVNPTKFTECFERAMARLEDLTPHQMEVYEEVLEHPKVHLMGPAGSGKTFLAMHTIREALRSESNKRVVFITRNESLCLHLIKSLYSRKTPKLESNLFVLFINSLEGVKEEKDEYLKVLKKQLKLPRIDKKNTLSFEPYDCEEMVAENSSLTVIIDEAHHMLEKELELFNFGLFDEKSEHEPVLRTLVDCFPNLEKLLLLSDLSQSELTTTDGINEQFETMPVELKEVIRNSKHVMTGGKCYAVRPLEVKSHHNFKGLPIDAGYLYSVKEKMTDENMFKWNLVFFERALKSLTDRFQSLNFSGRLAIIVPNKVSYERYREKVESKLKKFNMEMMSAVESNKTLHKEEMDSITQFVVFDTIGNMDGLESLIVIGLDFDEKKCSNEGRSACHRMITRAQMCVLLIGPVYSGGYFEFLGNVTYDSKQEDDEINPGAVDTLLEESNSSKQVPSNHVEPHAVSLFGAASIERVEGGTNGVRSSDLETMLFSQKEGSNASAEKENGRSKDSDASYTSGEENFAMTGGGGGGDSGGKRNKGKGKGGKGKGEKGKRGKGKGGEGSTSARKEAVNKDRSSGGGKSRTLPLIPAAVIQTSSSSWNVSNAKLDKIQGEISFNPLVASERQTSGAESGTDVNEADMDMNKHIVLPQRLNGSLFFHIDGLLPLAKAAFEGDIEHMEVQKDNGVVYDEQKNDESNGMTALHIAASRGHIDIIDMLISRYSVNLDERDEMKLNVLHFAAAAGRLDTIKHLIEKRKVSWDVQDYKGSTPVHASASRGHLEAVQFFVETCGAAYDCKAYDNKTPFTVAAYRGHVNVMNYLADLGAQCDEKDKNNFPVLLAATSRDQIEAFKLLIDMTKRGGSTASDFIQSQVDKDNQTALHLAANRENMKVLQYFGDEEFQREGMNLEIKNKHGQTAVYVAAEHGKLDALKYLVDVLHMKTEERAVNGQTPFMVAARKGHVNSMEYLHETHSAQKDVKSNNGQSVFHVAAQYGHLEAVKYLVKIGLKPDVEDKGGLRPMHQAALEGRLEVMKYMVEECGVDHNPTNKNGITPLHFAAKNGHVDVLRYLIDELKVEHDQPTKVIYKNGKAMKKALKALDYAYEKREENEKAIKYLQYLKKKGKSASE